LLPKKEGKSNTPGGKKKGGAREEKKGEFKHLSRRNAKTFLCG